MKPALKYWIFLLAIINLIFGVILASVVGSWFNLSAEEQAFVEGIADKIIPFPLLGAFVLVGAIGTLVSLIFRYYIIPILQLAEQTRLISAANPDYRIPPRGAKEVQQLAGVINDSADAFRELQTDVDEKIRKAQAALNEERNRLAALMSELPGGVLVCNTDGQILLYNQQAQTLLQPPGQDMFREEKRGGWLGLGRSIFGVLDRDPIVHALELLQQAAEKGQSAPTSGFMTTLHEGRCLRVNMAPVVRQREGKGEISGFVLTLQDMTRQIEADTRRDTLIQTLTDQSQSALGEIRQSISTILSEPQLRPEQLEGYRQIIDRASRSLQEHLTQARQNYARHLQALSRVEDVLAESLLKILQKNLRERFAIEVDLDADEGLWLKLDSYSLVQAVSHLAVLLKGQKQLGTVTVSLKRVGRDQASMILHWPRACLDRDVIREWEETPLITDAQGKLLSVREMVTQHGGALSIEGVEGKACHKIRIDFPADVGEQRIEVGSHLEERPVYYEFDLFHQSGGRELGQQPLRALTYVVFDTETTGLQPAQGDEVIQLGAIRIVNGRLRYEETVDQLVDPRRSVPEESIAVHGIRPHLLEGQPTIDKVLPHFHQFAEGAVLVAHNAAFDMRCLQLKEEASGVRFDHPVLDTLLLSTVVHPTLEGHSLESLAERYNLTIVGRHTALGDSIVTAEVLLKLIPLLEAAGIHTLEEAVLASAASPYARIKY